MKPYGFEVIDGEIRREFKFTNRDWCLLTHYGTFSSLGPTFKALIGLDALEFVVVGKKYSVLVNRTKRYFENQLLAVKRSFEIEHKDITTDFSVLFAGSGDSPTKKLHFEYLNLQAAVYCEPGFCTLTAYDMGNAGASRDIVQIDLRRFRDFVVDNEKVIRLRKKKRESNIGEFLSEITNFIQEEVVSECFQIRLVGG